MSLFFVQTKKVHQKWPLTYGLGVIIMYQGSFLFGLKKKYNSALLNDILL